jgi:FKBP-type peptidyl-prolyl cis-trans isomerase FkpA
VGTEKRERQKAARLDKISAQATAAKRDRTRGTAIRIAVAAVVVSGILFGISRMMCDGDSDTETSSGDETSTTLDPTDTTTPEYTNPDLAEQVLARQAPTPAPPPADTPATALESTTLIEGEGTGAQTGDLVTVHYAGVLSDGTQFDESWSRGQPFPVTLGAGEVIAGWDQGLVGAKIGERRHLVIGSDNAYGPQGRDPIPPNAPLAFDVDVVDIQPAAG